MGLVIVFHSSRDDGLVGCALISVAVNTAGVESIRVGKFHERPAVMNLSTDDKLQTQIASFYGNPSARGKVAVVATENPDHVRSPDKTITGANFDPAG